MVEAATQEAEGLEHQERSAMEQAATQEADEGREPQEPSATREATTQAAKDDQEHQEPSAAPITLEFHGRKPITFKSASGNDADMIRQLGYLPAARKLRMEMWERRGKIEALVRRQLGLRSGQTCTVVDESLWPNGSFNLCIPVDVQLDENRDQTLFFRCPMPHRLAEDMYPGTMDEKLGCEVGAYCWMQENCSEIRIPHLYSFGFSDGRHFTHIRHRPFYVRYIRRFWQYCYRLVGYPPLSNYTPHSADNVYTPYVLLEYIDPSIGRMLSVTWEEHREDPARRQNLFRSMTRVMLALARIPQPRIGSFQFQADCTVTLTNRPLTCTTVILENEGTPRTMQPHETYTNTESYVSDVLTMHDQRLLSNRNATYGPIDCRDEMGSRLAIRAIAHHFIKREQRNGPFLLQLTDFHRSNFFVDDAWNITCLLDLEWLCALPADMLDVPYWLTGCAINELKEENLTKFDLVRHEFMDVLEEEELRITAEHDIPITKNMQGVWESKGVWFWHSLSSINALVPLFMEHLCPKYSVRPYSYAIEAIMPKFWCEDSEATVEKKVADYKEYNKELRRLFGEPPAEPGKETDAASAQEGKSENAT